MEELKILFIDLNEMSYIGKQLFLIPELQETALNNGFNLSIMKIFTSDTNQIIPTDLDLIVLGGLFINQFTINNRKKLLENLESYKPKAIIGLSIDTKYQEDFVELGLKFISSKLKPIKIWGEIKYVLKLK